MGWWDTAGYGFHAISALFDIVCKLDWRGRSVVYSKFAKDIYHMQITRHFPKWLL